MTRTGFNWVLLVALVLSVVANLVIGRDTSKPNYDIMPDMAYSIPYDSFSPNPNFADGKTLQPPIAGTIPRGHLSLYYEATPEDALRAGEELQNPYTAEDAMALQRGAKVYEVYCLPCHGAAGKGDGLVATRGFPPPPPLEGEKAVAMQDGQIFHLVTYGQGNMPSYAGQVAVEDRWKVTLHVRVLQEKARRQAERAAAQAEEEAAANAPAAPPEQTADTKPRAETAAPITTEPPKSASPEAVHPSGPAETPENPSGEDGS